MIVFNRFINSNKFSDGTVPVLSLGYMCAPSGGWTKHADLYNPGHSPVVLKEYIHEQSDSKLDVRGGSKAGDHVDILGNWEMTVRILFLSLYYLTLIPPFFFFFSLFFNSWIFYKLFLIREIT